MVVYGWNETRGFFKILGEAEDLGDGVRFGHPFGVVFPLNSGMSHFMLIRAEWKMEVS